LGIHLNPCTSDRKKTSQGKYNKKKVEWGKTRRGDTEMKGNRTELGRIIRSDRMAQGEGASRIPWTRVF
jgi:hypothetical protein